MRSAIPLAALLGLASLTLGPAPAPARAHAAAHALTSAAQPNMVEPESLAQGFVLVVEDKARVASTESPIFLASNFNGWNPNDPTQRLEPRSDGRWQITVRGGRDLDSRMAFKFTRGSWETCEVNADLSDAANRSLPMVDAAALAPGERPVIELTIERWRDERPWETAAYKLNPYHPLEVTGVVRRMQVTGGGVPLFRDVLVWLPPGYDEASNARRLYPVLYLHDGQNVFEQMPGVPGEWHADESAQRLVESGELRPFIIVAIPHAEQARATEYLPAPVRPGVEARGDAYADFVLREVMPRIERQFRVSTEPRDTFMGGASLGGVISLHIAQRAPGRFGGLLLESMPVAMAGGALLEHFAAASAVPPRIYLAVGTAETGADSAQADANRAYVDGVRRLAQILRDLGVAESNLQLVVEDGAIHNETAWARRLPGALRFLIGPPN